jgi:hypothetical protein
MDGRPETDRPGTAALLSDILAGFGRLVAGELRLARAELAESLRAAGGGALGIGLAAVASLVGLNQLASAATLGLIAAGLGPAAAAALVGVGLLGLSLVLFALGRAALRRAGFWPRRAIGGLRRDAETVLTGLKNAGATDA